jgi:hypothetical protein
MRRLLLPFLLSTGVSIVALAQGPPMVPEIPVNTYTTGSQLAPVVAMDGAGDFVVAWEAYDGNNGIGARTFDQTGTPFSASAFQVNSDTTSTAYLPAVAADRNGDFVVVWTNRDAVNQGDVHARRYVGGLPTGPEFVVNTYTTDAQYTYPQSVAMSASGDFVVVWTSYGQDGDGAGIFGQRFDASGNKLGSEFQVNTYTTGQQNYPAVAMNAAHQFVVAWQSNGQDGSGYGVFARLYDATGTPGSEIPVNTFTTANQRQPSVAMDRSGNFVVAWDSVGQDGSLDGVFGRRFDPSGAPLGGEFQINTYTTDVQNHPELAMDPNGNFVCTWQSNGQDGSLEGVFAQVFDSAATPVGSEFLVNAATTLQQNLPAIAMGHHDSFVITYSSRATGNDDIVARVSSPAAVHSDVDANAVAGTSSNVNGVLETGETVQVVPRWLNVLNAPLAVSAVASNIRGPAGPTYTINDDTADYGTIPALSPHNCFNATGDCYLVTVSGARPAPHWDVKFDETLSTGMVETRTLHVGESFPDVPTTNNFYSFVETIFHNEITGGCAGGGYCPGNSVTRAQMAVFLLKSEHGGGYLPPSCAGIFTDVACPSQFADWIEQLYHESVTGGCVASPLKYCPGNPVTRAQMAAFLLKVEHGPGYAPPTCTGVFTDVACPSLFADWIEQLYTEGVTGGCVASPLQYCPNNPNTRGQMAVFLTKTFGFRLYPP